MIELSAKQARAIALSAQHLAAPRPERVSGAQLRGLAESLGVVQIDSVNVLVRSHYLPAFSRLGVYDPAELDRFSHHAPRALFEYWGHEASLLPVALQPLFRWRMALAHQWRGVHAISRRKKFLAQVLAIVGERGPIGAGQIELGKARKTGWWEWSDAKRAIEYLFWTGQVTTAARRGFERLYDLTERVIPAEILARPTPKPADAHRQLVEISARALGVATERDLRDYYRLAAADARAAIATLVEEGVLAPARVASWRHAAYVHRDAKPAVVDPERCALLSPFDSLIWARERTERMFGMTYRLEIYTPEPKRVHGYYVLPFLLGDELVARVDLKADRAAGVLRVQAAHLERGAKRARVAAALAGELFRMTRWLALERVEVAERGDLAKSLAASLRRTRS